MTAPHISDLQVERLVLGELEEAEARRVRTALEDAGDPRLDQIATSNREILAQYPAAEFGAAIRARAEASEGRRRAEDSSRSWLSMVLVPIGVAAAVAVAYLGLYGWPGSPRGKEDTEGQIARLEPQDREPTTSKGTRTPALSIVRKGDGAARASPLRDGDSVHEGDRLQVTYTAAGARHGVIVSIDGRGEVILHHPATADASTALLPGSEVALSSSYELDDAPSFERFVLVTADDPLDVEAVMTAARSLAAEDRAHGELGLASTTTETSLVLRK